MPSEKKKKNRAGFRFDGLRNVFSLNIGTILFGALFIYMLISLFIYLTATHITSYQVTSGPLSRNQTYTALVERQEEIVTSTTAGDITYYARDNSKVQKSGAVFAVGSAQSEIGETEMELTDEQLVQIRSSLATFSNYFDSNNFYDAYSFKYELEGSLVNQYASLEDVSDGESQTLQTRTIGGQTVSFAPSDGLVLFSVDGYEEINEETLSADDFSRKAYEKSNLRTEAVNVGDQVYKLVTSEQWSLLIPLSEQQVVSLAGRETIKVRFQKDGTTQTGKFTLIDNDNGYFAKISFSSGMIRYASDRFLEIELVTNNDTGLKIPLSALVDKDFYVIPMEYATNGGTSDDTGFLRATGTKDDDPTEFVSATIYDKDDNFYYVDTKDFEENDVLVRPDSTERFTVKDTSPLEGVYCINKGYAVFRKVNIIDQNEEYCIVESGTAYGLAQYDNIVYDSSTVKEEEVLY